MINFICLKWGDKYSAEFVNRMYSMLDRHFDNFTLHCITEDVNGIIPEVEIIPLPEDNLEKWWWKMWLFNENWMTLDNAVFLDLDLIIQKPFDIVFNDKPTFLYTDWIDCDEMWKGINEYSHRFYDYCEINSSILTWNKDTNRHDIWGDFCRYRDRVPSLFKGIDNYINNRLKDKYCLFETGLAHSYWTTGQTWADVPVILFDYNQDKQDTVDEDWVIEQWK